MKKIFLLFVLASFMIASLSCTQQVQKIPKKKNPDKDLSKFSQATFASGCFWCVEGVFESVKGVHEVISGYAGGKEPNPTYEQVSSHTTDHAETIQVYYDSTLVSYATLLQVYFASQDPTQVNGQGPDNGASYRSIIFYKSLDEKSQAEKYISEIQKQYTKRIAARLLPFDKFWQAEDYHQDYIQNNPDAPYVKMESIPRIKRFQKQFPELIKAERRF
ncbi:MAG: peptide-methionine (S)-S-oxide reductase MsrA [Daejeonella sp.]|uniref:peptide-methionine (S)-S-oxide reductase MsrA n=1 Tax=Daejeonella sp. TaxID=2805397 RepID=UPI003C724F62